MNPTGVAYTYDDLRALPDDGKRHELIDGDFYMTPSPGFRHQKASKNLFVLLEHFIRAHDLGELLYAPFDVILSPTDVVEPDLLFVAKPNVARLSERGVEGPVDLAVEIRSPSTEHLDMDLKKKLYARFGVPEYWVLDPAARRVELYRLEPQGYRLTGLYEMGTTFTSPTFPGLEIPVSAIFA